MDIAPPPPSLPPRALGPLLSDSWETYRAALPDVAVTVAWGVLPAALVTLASAALTGIDGREALRAAVEAEEYGRVATASAFGIAARFLRIMAGLAVFPVIAGRVSGTSVPPGEAYAFVLERLGALVTTVARQILYVLLGTLCLVIPGIILAFRYALTQPAVLLEGLRGPAALARSKEFMTTYPGKIFGNVAVAWLATVVAVFAAAFGLGLAALSVESVLPKAVHPVVEAVRAVAGSYCDELGGAWLTAFLVLLYGDLMRAHPRNERAG